MFLKTLTIFAAVILSCSGASQQSYWQSFKDILNSFGHENNGIFEKPITPFFPYHPMGCGYRYPEGIGYKVIGLDNDETEYGEFPWVVAILEQHQMSPKFVTLLCGGSLIYPEVVLTAAHCVLNKERELLKVRAGEWDLRTKAEPYPDQDRYVRRMVIHEYFHEGDLSNDIALLFVNKPFTLTKTVGPICLPPADTIFDYSNCFVTGWGKDPYYPHEDYKLVLKKYELTVIPSHTCESILLSSRSAFFYTLHQSFICAGAALSVNCKADGGSPLVCPIPGMKDTFYQAGILTWGDGCRDGVPGVYASVAFLKPWIDKHLECALNGLPFC